MTYRSMLFAPGNRLDRMSVALASGADAVVLDLEDSVPAPGTRTWARANVAQCLSEVPNGVECWVRESSPRMFPASVSTSTRPCGLG